MRVGPLLVITKLISGLNIVQSLDENHTGAVEGDRLSLKENTLQPVLFMLIKLPTCYISRYSVVVSLDLI